VIVVFCGVALLVSLWLPWANVRDYPKQNFTYALTKPAEIKYILYTDWGPPVLVVGLAVIAMGVLMLVLGPRRWLHRSFAPALAVGALVVLYDAGAAMHALYGWGYAAGTGVLAAIIVALILPLVGFAVGVVGWGVRSQQVAGGGGAGSPGPPGDQAAEAETEPAVESAS